MPVNFCGFLKCGKKIKGKKIPNSAFVLSSLMPIEIPMTMRPMDQAAFGQLDYRVMKHVFDCHNDLGRFCDERAYQLDVLARLSSDGFEVCREVRITASYQNFFKEYLLDLVISSGAIYEFKATTALTSEHETQLLNYLFLTSCRHGKLLNFFGRSVTTRFVNATVSPQNQRRYKFQRTGWLGDDGKSTQLVEILDCMCREWGVFLESRLYVEGLVHFLGGESAIVRTVTLLRNRINIGTQKLHLLSDDTFFRVTSIPDPTQRVVDDLRRLLLLTPFRRLQWINFNRHTIELTTLGK